MSLSSQLMLTPSIIDTLYVSIEVKWLYSVMLMRKISLKIQNVFRHSLGSLLNKLLVSSIDEPSCHQNTRYKLVLQTLYLFSLVRNSFWLTDKQNGRHLPPPWWKVLMHWSDISTWFLPSSFNVPTIVAPLMDYAVQRIGNQHFCLDIFLKQISRCQQKVESQSIEPHQRLSKANKAE